MTHNSTPLSDPWMATDEQSPPVDTPVLLLVNGVVYEGELRWESPGHEDTFAPYQYYIDVDECHDCWEHSDVTHWMHKPALPKKPVLSKFDITAPMSRHRTKEGLCAVTAIIQTRVGNKHFLVVSLDKHHYPLLYTTTGLCVPNVVGDHEQYQLRTYATDKSGVE